MTWVSVKDQLPEEGKYVLARHSRGTWHDSEDQAGVNCVVVKLRKGISKEERKKMKSGELPSHKVQGRIYAGGKPVDTENERWRVYRAEDEYANNLMPYAWTGFGGTFFGQEITHWILIPEVK